jgi:CBS domain-containing protein
MTGLSKLIMTDPEEPVLAAAKKLVDGEIDSLPVVRPIGASEEKTFEVVGRLTKTNITRLLVEMGQGKRR